MRSKKYLVLGTGVGKAIAYMLAKSANIRFVVIGDMNTQKAGRVSRFVNKFYHSKCIPMVFDAEKTQNIEAIFKKFDVVISALPAKYNLELAEAAILAGTHFCDLGGVVEVTRQMLELNRKYPEMSVSIVPDCGLMPGLGIVIAKKLMDDLGGTESIEILVGGLPQKPQPPTFYQLVYNPEGLRHICYDLAPILIEGEIKLVPPFYGYDCIFDIKELNKFSKIFKGWIETFVTAGSSVAAWSFQKLGVNNFVVKTVRWPGFAGFFKKIPADKFEQVVKQHLTIPVDAENPDLVWMRVTVQNSSTKKSMSLLDLFDPKTGLTAMQRTTGFITAIIAEMMTEGKAKSGINTPENAFDPLKTKEIINRASKFFALTEN